MYQKLTVPRIVTGMVRNRCSTGSGSLFHANFTATSTPNRPDVEAAAPFGEVPAAVTEVAAYAADPAGDERVAAKAPPGGTVGDDEPDAPSNARAVDQRVASKRTRPVERHRDRRQLLDAAAQHPSVAPVLMPERIHRAPTPLPRRLNSTTPIRVAPSRVR